MARKLVVLDMPGLSTKHIEDPNLAPNLNRLAEDGCSITVRPVAPAVTMPVQTSLLTGCYPSEHGIVANGFYDRTALKVEFWEQPAGLVERQRIWTRVRRERPDFKTAVLFWQSMLFADVDWVVTPKPLHLDDRLIQWCYSKPVDLYDSMVERFGPFPLQHYWGPQAGLPSSQWIVKAAHHVLDETIPDLMLVYIPLLDYNTQRFGPSAPQVSDDLRSADALVGELADRISVLPETDLMIFSEYTMSPVRQAILPNLLLREAGLLSVRTIDGREYPDFELSKAFAMVDHQAAHIFCKTGARGAVRELLEQEPGIEKVFEKEELGSLGLDHPRSGDLFAISRPDCWFAYYWWPLEKPGIAPAFANTVDIHKKPGYDPLELFWDPDIKGIPTRPELIQGSHGHPDIPAVAILPATMEFEPEEPVSTVTLGQILLTYLLSA